MLRIIVVIVALVGLSAGKEGNIAKAKCDVAVNKDIGGYPDRVTGTVEFTQTDDGPVSVEVNLSGFDKGGASMHGFHVHEKADIAASCSGAGGHFNPLKKKHGGRGDAERHIGDLENIEEDADGKVSTTFTDSVIRLTGENNIIGKAIVVHLKADDRGRGGDEGSEKTGNAGGRLACCVIENVEGSGATDMKPTLLMMIVLGLAAFLNM